MKTIVPISSGLDSTYVLWKLLTETQDEITAVLFDLSDVNRETINEFKLNSFNVETSNVGSADKIIQWLRANVRDFTFKAVQFSEDIFLKDDTRPNNPPGCVVRYALPFINDGTFDQIVLSNEKENDGFANGGTVTIRRNGAWVAHEEFVFGAQRGKLNFMLLDMNYTQGQAFLEMPQELIELATGFDHAPMYTKGLKRKFFKDLADQGKTPQEMYDIYMSKCITSNGRWHSMKNWIMDGPENEDTTWDMPTWPSSYEVPSSG
jgi:hypothetical protein